MARTFPSPMGIRLISILTRLSRNGAYAPVSVPYGDQVNFNYTQNLCFDVEGNVSVPYGDQVNFNSRRKRQSLLNRFCFRPLWGSG